MRFRPVDISLTRGFTHFSLYTDMRTRKLTCAVLVRASTLDPKQAVVIGAEGQPVFVAVPEGHVVPPLFELSQTFLEDFPDFLPGLYILLEELYGPPKPQQEPASAKHLSDMRKLVGHLLEVALD